MSDRHAAPTEARPGLAFAFGLGFAQALLGLTVAALAVRAAFLWLEPATRLVGDERLWRDWAFDLLAAEVRFSPLRSSILFHPPLYPYFIASLTRLFGSLEAVKWAQVTVSALLVPAVGRIGRRVFGADAGLVAAAVVAFYPELVWFSVHFWCETVLLTLWWWGMERVLAADAEERTGKAVAAGLLFALAVLTRETVLLALPIAALFLATRRPRPKALARAAVFAAAALLAIAPWTYRNWVAFRAFVPVSTAGGLALYQGNSELSREEVYEAYHRVDDQVARYAEARKLGLEAIRARQPWWFLEKLAQETPKFWETDSLVLIHITRGAYGAVAPWAARATAAAVILSYGAVLALSIAGIAAVRLDRAKSLLLATMLAYFLAHVVTHGFARYRLPVMPVLFLFAGWAAAAFWARRFPRLHGVRWALAGALGVTAAWVAFLSIRATLVQRPFAG